MRSRLRGPSLIAIAILTGCDHTEPFQPPDYGAPPPPAGVETRFTYNLGRDQSPAWLPDGSGFYYARERTDRPDRDWCLALMPAAGGAIRNEICDVLPAAADSTDAWQAPGPGPGGRIGWVRATSFAPFFALAPYRTELVVGTTADPAGARVLRVLPALTPSGRPWEMASQIRWLGPGSIVFLAERVAYQGVGQGAADTLRWGEEIVRAELDSSPPILTTLPGSDQASSVTVSGPDTVFYTTNGDSRVYRLVLSTGSITTVHDFGSAGIARDVQVAGGRLLAVVGGDVSFYTDSILGPVQRDGGGVIYLVDLATSSAAPLTGVLELFRHPALSPAGDRLVAEKISGGTSDIWAVGLP